MFKSPSGRLPYAQVVTLLLITLGLGIVAWSYFMGNSGSRSLRGRPEAPGRQMDFQERILHELETETKNRFFSHEQTAEMLEELSRQRGQVIAIECPMGDMDACLLGTEIDQVLEAAGWVVEEFLIATRKTTGKNLILRARDPSAAAKARVLVELLGKGGYPVETEVIPGQGPALKIVVPARDWPTIEDRKVTTGSAPGSAGRGEGYIP